MARAIPVIELVLGICADLAFLLQGFERVESVVMRVAYACGLCVAYLVSLAYFATWYRKLL